GAGRQMTDSCDIVNPANAGKFGDRSPIVEALTGPALGAPVGTVAVSSLKSCHVDQAWLTQLKFLGSYTVPKIDVQIGASFQNIPGLELAANYAMPNSVLQTQLGHLPAGAVATGQTTVALIPPESTYYDRINQMALRLGKILR